MVSVHPTLFCDAGELTHPRPMSGYEEAIGAPLRTGWIYVFFRGRLWRELSVVTSEDAAPILRDTPVEQARTAPVKRPMIARRLARSWTLSTYLLA